jgi:predicted ribosome-associated RNA-binding protein Tma20
MVARYSKLVAGKPCLFVRRKINPDVANLLGIEADKAERLITTIGGLQVINNSKNILGYGVVGYECVIQAITNYKAVAWCDDFNL